MDGELKCRIRSCSCFICVNKHVCEKSCKTCIDMNKAVKVFEKGDCQNYKENNYGKENNISNL